MRFRERAAAVIPQGRWALTGAAATWLGAAAGMLQPVGGLAIWAGGAIAALLVLSKRLRPGLVAALVVAGLISGGAAARRIEATLTAPVESGPVHLIGEVASDPVPVRAGWGLLLRTIGPPAAGLTVMVETADRPGAAAADVVSVTGRLRARPGRLRGDPYSGVVSDADVALVMEASGPLFGLGNALRGFVLGRLAPHQERESAGLLAGFLVGDTTNLDADRLADLRSSGLTHYVAVSGSNVALFLAAWWLVTGPLPLSRRLRALGGLAALAVFVVATRWEPSVVRAAAMAAVVLGGRFLGFPVPAWRALGVAVTVLLLVSGDLAVDVGFQLSVGATAGVLVGARLPLPRGPRWLWRTVVVTAAAQLAVLPILLATFGTVPLLSPVANLLAAPIVTVATVAGGIGVLSGSGPVLSLALGAADGVLAIAGRAAGWPQLGVAGSLGLLAGLALLRVRRLRPAVAAAAAAWVIIAALPVSPSPWPEVAFLDVGQGDAIVLRSPDGATVLVDGGPDPRVLEVALRRNGVGTLDLLVVTHGDSDHVGGLSDILEVTPVGEIWFPDRQERSELLDVLLEGAAAMDVPVKPVASGHVAVLGELQLQVVSPGRRYAAENDGSVVLWVAARGATALLTGDVQAIAQAELPSMRPDVLQVPHHGSATTDLDWLARTTGQVAVISVGDNSFGHPTDEVLGELAATGATVYLTQRDGDVIVPLCRSCAR